MAVSDVTCAWTRTVEPSVPAITIADARAHTRYTDNTNDAQLDLYIQAAVHAAEDTLGRGLITQTWKLQLDYWADVIPLPMAAPLQSVTSVKYYDADGVQQTLATSYYDTDSVARPACLVRKPLQTFPTLQSDRLNGRVEIVYVVGWTAVTSVPELIKHGLRMYVAYLDLNRNGFEAGALEAKTAAERCWTDRVTWTPPQWCY